MKLNQVNIRLTHPLVYKLLTAFAVLFVLLAVNFWTSNPTFNPFDINKNWVGAVFLVLGGWQLFWLNAIHNLGMVRLGTSTVVGFAVAWGGGNLQQTFAGKASFQLPLVFFFAIAAVHWLILQEPVFNPLTAEQPQ